MKDGQIADILEIRDLALRYAQTVDRRDGQGLAGLFAEEGYIDGSGYYTRGRKGLAGIPAFLDGRYLKTFHAVQNHRVQLDGDLATGEVYAISHHLRAEPDDSLSDYVMVMRYHDEYVREPDGWRFARRSILVDWTETRPATLPRTASKAAGA
jgi:hypothetical protein